MKKTKTLLPNYSIFFYEIEEKIENLLSELGFTKYEYLELSDFVDDALYEIISLTGNISRSIKMLEVALKIKKYGETNKKSIDLVIDYYCINKLGFFKDELEEMIK